MEMNTEAKWYVLHTNPGYENVAQENLKRVIEKNNLSNRIFDIVIPTEDVVEEKNGKKVIVTRKLMPTYAFSDDAYLVIKDKELARKYCRDVYKIVKEKVFQSILKPIQPKDK